VHYDIAVSAQDVPQTLYPRPGETVSALRPQFVLLTDGDDLGVNFYFEVADNPEFNLALFSGPVVGQNEQTSWSPELNLLANTDYYWRARAEMSAWSEPIAFSVSGEIHVTPNPYRPAEHGVYITFRNLPPSAHLRILTVTGDLVKEFRNVPGPDLPWDVTNDRGEALASGVYLYYIEADGANAAGKFMVIR
jgi:hypothetical protein